MREKQAEEKGYRYTGIYARNRDELKLRITEEFKSKGYKAVICEVPDSKLSRGGRGMGYSIYAELKYLIDEEIRKISRELGNINNRKQEALEEYNRKILEIDNRKTMLEERLNELGQSS